MSEAATFFILSFSSLVTLVNPIGLSPVFLSLVEQFDDKERRRVAIKGVLTAFTVLIVFALIGRLIFSFYGITISGFKIAGGILFFRTGIHMIEARISRARSTPKEESEAETKEDIAFTPIGMPIIAGPGSISSVMILSSEAANWEQKMLLLLVITLVMGITYFVFKMADNLTRRYGTTGLRITQRIMGLILMVIAVEIIISGAEPIIRSWIHPPL
ncbi:MAG: MarC family protein [Candidatus Marinimicrobia bacterium]|jgi:multiple antibiotic resistance protein|nr:MarC family protein [Candidatus Neomarinimicrobiota bacterium]MDP6936997.1 MarC family protein [Candidatus Neomarinimicrobiota bacterium]